MGLLMRRQLRKFLPIVLMALVVQIFAPIAACWAGSIGAPPAGTAICHDDGAPSPNSSGPSGQTSAHDGCCAACSLAQPAALDVPPAAVVRVNLPPRPVVWHEWVAASVQFRTGSHAQARAPPPLT
jgi:hypothetical protein